MQPGRRPQSALVISVHLQRERTCTSDHVASGAGNVAGQVSRRSEDARRFAAAFQPDCSPERFMDRKDRARGGRPASAHASDIAPRSPERALSVREVVAGDFAWARGDGAPLSPCRAVDRSVAGFYRPDCPSSPFAAATASSSAGGSCGSIRSRASTIASATRRRACHLWSAGTTNQGAAFVAVAAIACS